MFILKGINGLRFNRDDNTKSNDENESVDEVEMDAKMINEEALNVGTSLTQETLQKFPEFFGPTNTA
jgi:hypothetical protein